MADETNGAGSAVAAAAATAVTPDQLTADLLRRHAANEKLTPSEFGKLGAFSKKVKSIFAGKAERGAQSREAGPGQPAAVGTVAPGQASGDGLAAVPPDPRLVQDATALLLGEANKAVERFISSEARKAGADDKSHNRIVAAASLPPPAKSLMIETSPQVAALLGLRPEHFPLGVFFGALSLWGTNLTLTVMELRQMRKKEKAPAEEKTEPAKTIKTPALPKGSKIDPGETWRK
jgi:hypothetical protein